MTKTKSIVVTVIALIILSMFSSLAIAGNSRRIIGDSDTQSGISSIVAEQQTVEDVSRSYDIGSINSCKNAKLGRGDSVSFTLDDKEYTLKQGLVGNRYTQLSFQGVNSRFYSGDAKRYDLDLDGTDDLQIAAYELLNSNDYLAICGLEHKIQDEVVEVSNVAEQESQDEVLKLADSSEEKATYSLFDKIVNWFN